MKRLSVSLFLLCFMLLLTGASIFEGAAAVSGSLPSSGMYVATNSFPRNTVIDLTNLGTGRTVRVIVTAGLDTPGGLLAEISREAAESIGLPGRTIGRVRMRAVSDPLTFSMLGDNNFRSNDADFNPLAAIEQFYGTSAPEAPPVVTPAPPVLPPQVDAPYIVPPVQSSIDQPRRSGQDSAWNDIPAAAITPQPPPPPIMPDTSTEAAMARAAEAERLKAEADAARAEAEKARAEAEREKAEAEKARGEAEKALAEMREEWDAFLRENTDANGVDYAALRNADAEKINILLKDWRDRRNEVQKTYSDNPLYRSIDDIPGARAAINEFHRKRDEALGIKDRPVN